AADLRSEEDADVPAERLGRLRPERCPRRGADRRRVLRRLAREVPEAAQGEEHAILERRVEAAHLVGIVVERAVLRLEVQLEVELDAEVALVARRLNELARAAPDERRPAADLLAVLLAEEVVVDAGPEVVCAGYALQDVAEEDQVDAIVGVEAELGVRAVGRE